jgi:hypothetical protein
MTQKLPDGCRHVKNYEGVYAVGKDVSVNQGQKAVWKSF